jgi:predicted phage baseplate assembly protein
MSCNGDSDCTCGCCSGVAVETPQGENNQPGLSSIAYRTGAWASFNASMLARLSSSEYPALSGLLTRSSDDFTIALLDATSVMLDILTFYQERLANESYIRTATQLSSLTQLSQLIGYQPSPGVSASVYLAFTLRAATGLPTNLTTAAITIPAGTQVQSVPAQGQTPQSFQTSADILAKPDWNALPVQTGQPWMPQRNDTSAYLAGTATQLNPGDTILIVGDERLVNNPPSNQWDFCHIVSVQPDTANQRTLIIWAEPLSGNGSGPASVNPHIYALRQRASLFGYNAINPLMLAKKTLAALSNAGLMNGNTPPDWDFGTDNADSGMDLASNALLDLDSVYAKLTAGGWLVTACQSSNQPSGDWEFDAALPRDRVMGSVFAAGSGVSGILSRPGSGGIYRRDINLTTSINLYHLTSVTSIARSDYGVSAKITRASTDVATGLSTNYAYTRNTAVFAQSELLAPAEQPFDHPLYGIQLDLEVLRPDLVGVTAVAVTGASQKISVNFPPANPPSLNFVPDSDPTTVPLAQGQVYTITQPPNALLNGDNSIPDWAQNTTSITLTVADASGRTGTIPNAQMQYFVLVAPAASDPIVQETALVGSLVPVTDEFPHTRILLQNQLLHCYCRATTTVNANVAAATAGSPVTELLGNGSAATPNQQFTLKQSPLTYAQAATVTGSQSSLQVTANGAAWTPVATLYNQTPTAQVYATLNLPGGAAQVQFGDGVEGATLPTGQSNIQAQYRIGIGSAGNVAAGAITTLVDRPVGVSGVTNPLPAAGGQDAQTVAGIRAKAPLTVLTLGRAVSIADYQNLAASYAGIAKAYAMWIPNGPNRGVFITVAAAGGAALPPGSQTLVNLASTLQSYGNPGVSVQAQSFLETTFGLDADLACDPACDPTAIQAAVLLQLQQTYSFANRSFGQGVTADEIAALIQGVTGVIAANVTRLWVVATSKGGDIGSGGFSISAYNAWIGQQLTGKLQRPQSKGSARICPYVPLASPGNLPNPAEILVLDPNPVNVKLGAMQ